jgi:hypothetical protein
MAVGIPTSVVLIKMAHEIYAPARVPPAIPRSRSPAARCVHRSGDGRCVDVSRWRGALPDVRVLALPIGVRDGAYTGNGANSLHTRRPAGTSPSGADSQPGRTEATAEVAAAAPEDGPDTEPGPSGGVDGAAGRGEQASRTSNDPADYGLDHVPAATRGGVENAIYEGLGPVLYLTCPPIHDREGIIDRSDAFAAPGRRLAGSPRGIGARHR